MTARQSHPIYCQMTQPPDLFPGFASRRIAPGDAEIFARIGGSGPPLLDFLTSHP